MTSWKQKRPSRFRIRWADLRLPAWKIFFAGVGLLDMFICGPLLRQGWNDARPDSGVTERYKLPGQKVPSAAVDDETCQAPTSSWLSSWYVVYVGPFFCALCLIAAIVQASEARQLALDNAALDNFERKLAKFYSSTRYSFRHQPHGFHEEDDIVLARNTLRSWTPVLSVLSMWFVLLPWPELVWGSYATCGNDTSIATVWLTYCMVRMREGLTILQTRLVTLLWDCVLPFKLYFHPKQLYQRIRLVFRWIRYLRFAGPLIRILLKLNDQFWVFIRTRSQSWLVQMEKAKRLASRSMLFEDIQRIESLAKVHTALASVPSQMFHLAQEQAAGVGKVLEQRKEDGKILRRKLQRLKHLISHGSDRKHPSSELYDRIVDLGQELKTTIGDTVFHKHLISPQTRFSVGWRIVVSCALMTELCRLYISFRLSGTFQISLTDMFRSLLSDCEEHMNKQFRQMSSNNGTLRVLLRNLLRLPTKSSKQAAQCFASQNSPLSKLILTFGQISEYTIDIVCFIDIFVWFFTGELDPNGVVVQKPFFARCILPGTLIQVLDHPTLPDRIPTLLMCLMNAACVVGYSRVLRWGLALIPAVDMLLLDPIRVFLFRPMDDDEWLRYTESLAILPVMSGTDIRNAFQSGNNLARIKHKSFVHAKSPSSTMFFPVDDSERSKRRGLGMVLDEAEYEFGEKRGSHLDDSTSFSYGLMAY